MKLKQVKIGGFGCLSDFSAQFSEGLNVIYGENGAGKSTFFSFLKASLYGFSRGSRLREKVLPWNGGTASGSILFDHEGEWTLQVRFGKTARGDKTVLLNNVTGEEKTMSGCIGRELFGMGEETFVKTACVGQAQLAISAKGQDEIAEKLANLEQTGEEGASYTACRKTIDDMLRELRAKRGEGGLLNQAERNVQELKDRERAAEEKSALAAQLYRRLGQLEQELEKTGNLLEEWKAFRLADQKRICLEYQQKIKQLALEAEGEDEEYEVYEKLSREWKQEEQTLFRLRQQQVPLPPREPVLCSREEFLRVTAGKKNWGFVFLIIGLFLAAAFAVGGWKWSPWWYLPGAICLAGAALAAFYQPKQPWEEYGAHSCLEFSERYTESVQKHSAYEAAVLQQKQLEEQIVRQQERLNEYREKGACVDCDTSEKLFALCSRRRERQAGRRTAAEQKRAFEELLNKALDGKTMEEVCRANDALKPGVSEEDLHQKQLVLIQERERLTQQQKNLFAENETPDVLLASRIEWEEKRDGYRKKEQVLQLAAEVLEQAYMQMEQQFGGALNRLAGKLLSEITGGKYQEARISRDYQVRLTEGVEAHPLEQFSGGLYDQAYLAFRLSMLELMESKTPVFLDDVMMQYDDVRAERAIRCLERYAARTGTQILLFTCRNRERILAKQIETVNCIEIL